MDNIKVTLLHYTPKEVLIEAMSMPYKTENFKKISTEQAMKKIKAICVDKKHSSVLEHITFNFKIEGISRLCLQELVRHRMASYTVESTRYTLPSQEEVENIYNLLEYYYITPTLYKKGNIEQDKFNILKKYFVIPFKNEWFLIHTLYIEFKSLLNAYHTALLTNNKKIGNDKLKYFLPESWRTNLVMSINIRSLRNFLGLRLSKQAHFEIRHLAGLIYEQIPAEYKVLFEDLGGKNE